MSPLLPFYYLCHINPQKIMDLLRYFYHPDHLGSSSWITDGSGNSIQHLHYLPFGEDWVDQRNSSWNAPYTFTGKEKDAETGYGYFGARYYDSGLSIWLSVDPMSDKYPSMSPYNYCANNPVILVDPDGKDVFLSGDNINSALARLQEGTNLQLSVDGNGKISAEGRALNKNDQKLLDAITSEDVDVRVNTNGANNGVGSNGGTKNNSETGKMDTFSNIDVTGMSNHEQKNGAPKGSGFMHEITEAYSLGLYSVENNRIELPAPSGHVETVVVPAERGLSAFPKNIFIPDYPEQYKIYQNAHRDIYGHTTTSPEDMTNREKRNYKNPTK